MKMKKQIKIIIAIFLNIIFLLILYFYSDIKYAKYVSKDKGKIKAKK